MRRDQGYTIPDRLHKDSSSHTLNQQFAERTLSEHKSPARCIDKKESRQLMEVFQDFIRLEKDLERQKIEITLRDDYNLIDAFGLLDA